jgi:hypothetical protein
MNWRGIAAFALAGSGSFIARREIIIELVAIGPHESIYFGTLIILKGNEADALPGRR